jgi:hypothetical protein
MRWIRSRRALLVAGVLGLALMVPSGAAAEWWNPPSRYDQGLQVVIKDAYLMNAITVDVYANVKCDYSFDVRWSGIGAWIKQVGAGRKIAYGMTTSGYSGIACDGQTHVVLVRITAEPGGVAFKSGSAMVASEAYAEGWGDEYWWEYVAAATGWVPVRLKQWPNNKPWPEPAPLSPPLSGPLARP